MYLLVGTPDYFLSRHNSLFGSRRQICDGDFIFTSLPSEWNATGSPVFLRLVPENLGDGELSFGFVDSVDERVLSTPPLVDVYRATCPYGALFHLSISGSIKHIP